MSKTSSKPSAKTEENPFKEHAFLGEIQTEATAGTVIKVRVISTPKGPRVDIRQHITSERFTGFTNKGVSLPFDQVSELLEMLSNDTGNGVRDFASMVPSERKAAKKGK